MTDVPSPPTLEFVGRFSVSVGAALVIGETALGQRRIVPITGGNVRGPFFTGPAAPS